MVLTPGAQVQIAAIHGVGYYPGNGDLSVPNAFQHVYCLLWLSLEAHRLWDVGSQTSSRVLDSVEGQIEFTVNQGMAARRDVGEKNPHLTILDLFGAATLLLCHAC
jgi:hypothetical protein